jgi:hypothetical protein
MYLYIHYTHPAVHRNTLNYIFNKGTMVSDNYKVVEHISKKWRSIHYLKLYGEKHQELKTSQTQS